MNQITRLRKDRAAELVLAGLRTPLTTSERIGHWTKTRRLFARVSGPEA
jgi:hypothetical protein